MKKNHWYAIKGQSLAIYARRAGFDLAMYENYEPKVQQAMRALAVKEALLEIGYACYEKYDIDILKIRQGIYVISLSNPLSVLYRNRRSQVIYIGRGNIMGRIKTHFEKKLFDFMLSLNGSDFDFHFAQPALPGTAEYFKHVEHLMLNYFCEQYGGLDDKRRFPILNKNAGTDKFYQGGTEWWKTPLKASGKTPLWEIRPTSFSEFAPLDDD